MKKVLAIFLALLMFGFAVAGCSSAPSESTASNVNAGDSETASQDDASASEESTENTETAGWDYIVEKGVLVVGLDDTFAPMGFRDEDNNLVGFDIDLANAVGEELGIEIEFKPIDWNSKEMELSSKKVDCLWNGMSATEERQESMALTNKYLNNKIVIMTLDPDITVDSVEDLQGLTIATQAGSAALSTMQSNESYDTFSANISEYPTYDECILDMEAGRIDCMVVDQVLGEYTSQQRVEQGKSALNLCSFDFGNDFYAIGCRKGETDVADQINNALKALIDSGKAAEISEKWFGTDIVIFEGYDE